MVSLQRNPFTWDKQNVGKTMNSTVISFKLLSEGRELAVNNLPSGDEFILEIPTPSATLVSRVMLKYPKAFTRLAAYHHYSNNT